MFECCNHCYKKYITERGDVDWRLYVKIEPEHDREDGSAVCMCECHQVNLTVLH